MSESEIRHILELLHRVELKLDSVQSQISEMNARGCQRPPSHADLDTRIKAQEILEAKREGRQIVVNAGISAIFALIGVLARR